MISKFLYLFNQIRNMYYVKIHMVIAPVLLLMILSMMIFPLSGFVLDVFFTFNIVLSIIILLGAMFIKNTLDFISFPTAILFSTLLRLSLNIGSTRTILLKGHTGVYAAGSVVKSFGHFLVGDNFTVGIVVFIILIVINFIVITKGAGRIAEVGARFALDGMPGKQMAIDADFNAGLINDKEAKKRRIEVYQESEFYGAMDGASKFIRGDAIAGILVMVINIIGGLIVGIIQHNMFFIKATQTYTLLTIGDGLVAQIPSLLISIAAGIMVTRINTNQNVTEQMINQIFCNPTVIFFTSFLLVAMGVIPGMPKTIFFSFSGILFAIGWKTLQLLSYENKNNKSKVNNLYINDSKKDNDLSWDDIKLEDCIRIEIGNKLTPLLSQNKKNNLLTKIRKIRKKFAQEIGFLPPVISIQSNLDIDPLAYRILIKGVEFGQWNIELNSLLAINVSDMTLELPGKKCIEPTFGLSSYWIDFSLKNKAEKMKFLAVDNVTVIATHFDKIIYENAEELFGFYEMQKLLDKITLYNPKLIEELVPNLVSLSILNRIFKNLLSEKIYIRDLKTILETILDHSVINKNADYLTSMVRIALGKAITQKIFQNHEDNNVIGLDPMLENILLQSFQSGQEIIEPGLLSNLILQTQKAINQQKLKKYPVVLVVQHKLRLLLSKILRVHFKELFVLSNSEIHNNAKIRVTNIIGKQINNL